MEMQKLQGDNFHQALRLSKSTDVSEISARVSLTCLILTERVECYNQRRSGCVRPKLTTKETERDPA